MVVFHQWSCPVASALDLEYEDYTSTLLKLGLLQISRRGAKITTNKYVWVNYFTTVNIDNYKFEVKKSSKVENGKVKRLNLCYLQLGVSQDKLKCNPSIQSYKGERRPWAILHILKVKFHQ